MLGYQRFHELAYHVIIGNQVVVKGKHKLMVKSAINCLKVSQPMSNSKRTGDQLCSEDLT